MVDTVKLLEDLISTPSVNPAFLPAGHPRAGEARAADLLAAAGHKAGLDVERQEVSPGRHNLLIRLAPKGRVRKRVWLAPHLDTVNAADEQFAPTRSGDKLFGRGACDTKGSVAAMFAAVCDVAEGTNRPYHTEIMFAALVDEEQAQMGSRALGRSGLKADLAIVGEPTLNRIVTAHKGNLWIRLEATGKAAHGSRPTLGKNAVHEMAKVVDLLETKYAALLARRTHPILGAGTVNVGAIRGGTQPNIVPDRCSIEVDRRTLPGETERGVLGEIKQLLKKNGLKAAISMHRPEECHPMETSIRLELVASLLRTARQQTPFGVDYFCDASILSQAGIPSVVFGPGDIAQAHTAREWISVRSLEKSRVILRSFLLALP